MITDIQITNRQILSNNKYKLEKITFQYRNEDGSAGEQTREVYDRGNGAVILLYNKAKQTVVLTRQFRLPSFVNGNASGILTEACAGLLEKENPEECIKRETEEETGYRISEVRKIFEAYMSPGSVSEILHFFVGEYTPAMKVSEGGGVDEDENIDVLEVSFDSAFDMMGTGEIKDAKTIILLQYARLNGLVQ